MRKLAPIVFSLALLVSLIPLGGCNKLEARMEIKKGNALYKEEAYKDALEQFKGGLEIDPQATFAWRSVGFTCMALYRPGVDTAENSSYADLAIESFQKYLEDYPDDEKAQEFLTGIYMNSERYDDAIQYYQGYRGRHPEDPKTDRTIALILAKAGRIKDGVEWSVAHPSPENQAEIFYTLGVTAWNISYNDVTLDSTARQGIVDAGLEAMQKAIDLKPQYTDAMAYFKLLYIEKAKLETDAFKKQEWIDKAEEWSRRAAAANQRTAPQPVS